MKIGTPNNIEVLLHHFVSPNPHPREEAPAVRSAIKLFLGNGCMKQLPSGTYEVTDKGEAWITALCNVEEPKVVYTDSNGNIL